MPQMKSSRAFVSGALAAAAALVVGVVWMPQWGGDAPSSSPACAVDDPDGAMLFDRSFKLGRFLSHRAGAVIKADVPIDFIAYTGPRIWTARGASVSDINGSYVAISVHGRYIAFRNAHGCWLLYSSATHICHITPAEDGPALYVSTGPMPPDCRWRVISGPGPAPSVTPGPLCVPAGGEQIARRSAQPPGGHAP